jgi:predicted NAD/FAD-binding protein
MQMRRSRPRTRRRVCVVGGGIAGLGAAWALARHPDDFEIALYEKSQHIGGNAVTVDFPQSDGSSIPVDISVTACIPTVYHNYIQLLRHHEVRQIPTRFSYSVQYGEDIYAHDFDSELKRELQDEIARFQRLLRVLEKTNALSRTRSILAGMLNPLNYVKMRHLLDAFGFSSGFRFKILKPMFVNFLLATNVFDMPASMFCRYLEFFNIERATSMVTWDQGTRNLYRAMTRSFASSIHVGRGVKQVTRAPEGVIVRDDRGEEARFDDVILACHANQALMLLDEPNLLERWLLSSVRYESELHNHAIVHSDESVLPENQTRPLETRSNFIIHYGSRPDNYEITYIMHNQQPWAARSDRPCLVTYNPIHPIDPSKVIARHWFQHVMHDVFHVTVLMNMFPLIQGRGRVWYCGAHTLVNSQEHCFLSGLTVARQLGADYPFDDPVARSWFNFYGRLMHGPRFCAA